ASPRAVTAARPDIDAHTIEPRWGGERLDVNHAIDALISAEHLHDHWTALGQAPRPWPPYLDPATNDHLEAAA
ncbi:MAG TPA: hypothetical protein VK866_13570, partial [Acidimicrobiales bacterium]|nr:hypothetical protein [Acidimicrobiales bacterium]